MMHVGINEGFRNRAKSRPAPRRVALAFALAACLLCAPVAAALPPGLWVGDITVDAVSEIVPSRPAGTGSGTPVAAEGVLPMRVLIHSDGEGGAHLLKWVTLMARRIEGSNGRDSFEEILVTQRSVFFEADVVGRFPDGDGRRGLRLFTIAFDWNGSDAATGNQLALQSTAGEITGTLVLGAQHPSNPFYHRFHNMHQAGRAVTRQVSFAPDPPTAGESPAIGGPDRVSGRYQEKIYGLNGKLSDPAQPQSGEPHIALGGRFELRRVSQVSALNGN